jgi:hypothetical protein
MDELDTLIMELDEAIQRGATKAKAGRLVRPLELAMRKAFLEQGALFVKKLRGLKTKFAEEAGDPYRSWAAQLEQPLRESITPAEWQKAWYEVEQSTIKLIASPVERAAARALEVGALAQIADLAMKIRWDLKNPRAKAYLDNYGAKMVSGVNETTRGILQTLIGQAMEEGWSYQRTAAAITERFREFAIGKPQAHIDSRAHLVAVTEVGNAYAEGSLIVARDLAAAGLVMEKSWSTVGDEAVSEGCLENEAAGWIAIEDFFPSGHQRPLRFPGCRCNLLTRIKR